MWFYQVFARGTELSCPAKFTNRHAAVEGAFSHAARAQVEPEAVYISNGRCLTDLSHDRVWGQHVKRTPAERAAPQLLEALKTAEDMIAAYEQETYPTLVSPGLARIRAAIAAAEGRSA